MLSTFQYLTCNGTVSSVVDALGHNTLNCSGTWGQSSGILLEPAYATQLQFMLDNNGLDWSAVGLGFGSCLALFASGVVFGAFYNLTRKMR